MYLGCPSSLSNTNLSDDIWLQIFLLLPLNLIFKLRCISKVWSTLLSNPLFINKWIKLNSSHKSLPWFVYHNFNLIDEQLTFLISYPKSLSSEFMPGNEDGFLFKFLKDKIYLLGASNGLVLCASSYYRSAKYYVCNPLTQKWASLPPTAMSTTTVEVVAGFTCESISSTSCYKVVLLPRFDKQSSKFNIEIFSSHVGEWNVYEVSRPEGCIGYEYPFHSLFFLSGVLHWFEEGCVLAYNLNNNNDVEIGGLQCRLLDDPELDMESEEDYYWESNVNCFGEYEGLLCFTSIVTSKRILGVWVFKEDWHLLYKDIGLHDLIAEMLRRFNVHDDWQEEHSAFSYGECDDLSEEVEILGFSPVDKDVILLGYKSGFWAFNIQTKRHEELTEPSSIAKAHSDYRFHNSYNTPPFVLKALPTVLPPPSWETTSSVDVRVSNCSAPCT